MKTIRILASLLLLVGCGQPPTIAEVYQVDGVKIALLDTGVSTVAIDEAQLLPGYNYVQENTDTADRINHGTAVSSVILGSESAEIIGIAPESFIIPLVVVDKVEGETESVPPEALAQAILDSVDTYGADIINVSLGIKKDVTELKEAVVYAEEQGVLVVSAVGNEGAEGDLYFPAAYETVLGVGSRDKNGAASSFSSQNGTADVLAPGEDIWLASRSGKTYGAKGTSYATGFATATAARLLAEHPSLSPAQLRGQLIALSQIP